MPFLDIQVEDLLPKLTVPDPVQVKSVYDGLVSQLHADFNGFDPNDIIQELKQDIIKAKGNEDEIVKIIYHHAYILPLLSLWSDKESSLEPTHKLLNRIEEICKEHQNGYIGLLQLRKMLTLFFTSYDELSHIIDELGDSLRKYLELYSDKELLFGLDKFKKNAEDFLNAKGHEHLAELTQNSGKSLPEMAKQYGIPINNSRFFEAAVTYYYVDRLKDLKPNEADIDLLHEVSQEEVYNTKADAHFHLGHHVLTILIDKLRGQSDQRPSELWLGTLLTIGHDPRVPSTDEHFQKWWSKLGNDYVQSMISWLSEVDLNLFLDIFTNFADEKAIKGKRDMQRMFEHRAHFLRGLLNKKCIVSTRLFLSSDAEEYVKHNWNAEQSPSFARLNRCQDREFAAFYLNLGTAHMVEGTHDFKLRIVDRIPSQSRMLSFDASLSVGHLTGLVQMYQKEFGDTGRCVEIRHDPQGHWRENAVTLLNKKFGVDVLLKDVTTANPYRFMNEL